ncbi:sulfite exporter TauE/SafE family protein [Candidatus Fermentibacterales bacterium]|nr:sulfite exporter TauE/SafE family protein [Candidatus Fermentibacterales bacterium]
MTLYQALLLFLAGVGAGFVNVSAGGGSLLTLPALIFLGLPTAVANGTNRLAILIQCGVSTGTFRRLGHDGLKLGLRLSVTAIAGAVLGSLVAVDTPDAVFRVVLSLVMVLALIVILVRRKGKAGCPPDQPGAQTGVGHPRLQLLLFFLIGLYGGFIQAGVGYLQIFALYIVGGLSLVRTNCVKIMVTGIYLIPSLAVFIADGKIAWLPALVLALGAGTGGWLGTTFAVRKGEVWIKAVLALAVLAMAGRLAGIY